MYQSKISRLIILGLLLFGTLSVLWLSGTTLASDDRAVDLASFIAEPLADGRIHLEWSTGSEQDTANFLVIRAVYPATPTYPSDLITITYNTLPTQQVPGQGAPGSGASYIAFDPGATDGVTYTYILVEQDTSGFFSLENDFAVTVQAGDVALADVVVAPPVSKLEGSFSSPAVHTFTVTNNGNRFDTIKLTRSNFQWNPTLSHVIISLAPGASQTVTATVTPPNGAQKCNSDTATLTVESLGVFNSNDSELAYVTTTRGAQACVFLPIIVAP